MVNKKKVAKHTRLVVLDDLALHKIAQKAKEKEKS
jgi:hypothetical protein